MGAEGGGSGNGNRWKSARERDRLRARFLVRSRVGRRTAVADGDDARRGSGRDRDRRDDDGIDDDECDEYDQSPHRRRCRRRRPPTPEETLATSRYLRRIIENDRSAFSVAAMVRDGRLLDRTLPAARRGGSSSPGEGGVGGGGGGDSGVVRAADECDAETRTMCGELLSTDVHWELRYDGDGDDGGGAPSPPPPRRYPQPTTLASSKYGRDYVADRLVPYMRRRRLSAMEYASLLGRHGIVGMMLQGGLDPTVADDYDDDYVDDDDDDDNDASSSKRRETASRGVLALVQSICGGNDGAADARGTSTGCGESSLTVPLSIWAYVVRAVVEMRMNGVLNPRDCDGDGSRCGCGASGALLVFGPPCRHAFCEPCAWDHLVRRVPEFSPDLGRNVISCPACGEEFRGFRHCRHRDGGGNAGEEGDGGGGGGGTDRPAEGAAEEGDGEEADDVEDGAPSLGNVDNGRRRRDDEERRRQRRRLRSLARFLNLPATSIELKSKTCKRRVDRDRACETWHDALRPVVDARQSRKVRIDRFFRAVLTSPHLTAALLVAGVDVNARNEYGQTPLYLACWRGSTSAVRSLLEYGADCKIASNGGSTCFGIARQCRRTEVLRFLEGYAGMMTEEAIARQINFRTTDISSDHGKCQVSVLIDPSVDHPGAGACIVDDAVSESQLEQLHRLWGSLPASECEEADDDGGAAESPPGSVRAKGGGGGDSADGVGEKSDKSAYRPSRHYFCDAEGAVRAMLEGCVEAARAALGVGSSSTSPIEGGASPPPPSSVFQNIRFLHYERAGGVLPPHVDLCRVDEASGLRSTHTFILYLTDCENGGGTALLKQLRDPRVIVVAQPRRGRALIFPHLCPHSGLEVVSAPKLLLRGEVIIDLPPSA